jgi:hypothetical protein
MGEVAKCLGDADFLQLRFGVSVSVLLKLALATSHVETTSFIKTHVNYSKKVI